MRAGIRNWDRLSLDEQEAVQLHRLNRMLREQVLPFSPFYRRRFDNGLIDRTTIKTLDDLRRIPFTTKQDLLVTEEHPSGPKDFILQPDEELIRTRLALRTKLGIMLRGLILGRERLRRRLQWEYNPSSMIFTTGRSTGSISLLSHALRPGTHVRDGEEDHSDPAPVTRSG